LISSSSSSRRFSSTPSDDDEKNDPVTSLVKELSSAKELSPELLQKVSSTEALVKNKRIEELKTLSISSGVGGGLIGLVTGGLLDGALANGDAPWSAPVGLVILGGASYYVSANVPGQPSELVQELVGKNTLAIGKSLKKSVEEAIDDAKSSAAKKISDTQEAILNIPANIKQFFVDLVENAKQSAQRKVQETVEDLQAIPTNIATSVKAVPKKIEKSIEKTAEDVAKNIEKTAEVRGKNITHTLIHTHTHTHMNRAIPPSCTKYV